MTASEHSNRDGTTMGVDHAPVAPVALWEVNEQLLLAGLREHELVDQLRRQLAFIRAITGSLGEGVFAVDGGGRITFVNQAAEQMLGWLEADVLGRDIPVGVQDAGISHTSIAGTPMLQVLRSGVTYRNDHALFTRQNGSTFPVAYSAAPIITDDQVVGVVVTFRDMSEMQRLQQLQEEYLTLISHDLRTPLAVILGNAQLLQRLTQQETNIAHVITSITAIEKHSLHMNRMIQDLLDRSSLEAGHANVQLLPVDLSAVVMHSLDQNLTPAERERLQVTADEHLPVVADEIQLERVIINLVTNALKYSVPPRPVVVRVVRADQEAMLSVMDQGVGIDANDLAHLFEKHYRARTAAMIAGTGLGLYSSRLIVEAHGGRIWAESEVGTGSIFWVSLPLRRP